MLFCSLLLLTHTHTHFPPLLLFPPSLPPASSGRVDATKDLDDFTLTASLTDKTVQDVDNAPWLKDALVTATTKKDGTNLLVGYDAGQKGALAGVRTGTELAGKDVNLAATWFQNGNHVRCEGSVALADNQSLWATKTLNDDNDVGNATVVNLAERKAFVIEPFNIPVSTGAVKYSIERDGYTVEPAYDLNTKGAFLSVSKSHKGYTFRPQYAFADEVALLEVALDDKDGGDRPLVRAFAKANAGAKGFGPVSIGVIGDKAWEF